MSNSLKQGFPRDITAGGLLKIDIAEGKEIHLEIPVEPKEEMSGRAPSVLFRSDKQKELYEDEAAAHSVRHVLKNCAFPVTEVRLGERTSFEDGVLTVRKSLEAEAQGCNDLVKSAELDIIYPDKQHVYTNSMMDVQPIAVKKEGMLGEGTTFEFGRPGAPDRDAFIIRLNVTIQEGCGMERPGPLAAHQALDIITQELREVLKEKDASTAAAEREYLDVERQGALRILLVKEIMGQGAMHDNLILPDEPCGFLGGRPNVDLGNVPVLLRPNEVLDGGIHALTCITPDTKETSLHYWREPYLKRLASDPEIDLLGVLFVGSPQANTEKFYVSGRVGAIVEALNPDGCIVTTEGFGNNHIDFASHIEQIGSLGIPVVGCSYCGVQGALVVGNKYMDVMVDHCVTEHGNVEDILAKNTGTEETAIRAVALVKYDRRNVDTILH